MSGVQETTGMQRMAGGWPGGTIGKKLGHEKAKEQFVELKT